MFKIIEKIQNKWHRKLNYKIEEVEQKIDAIEQKMKNIRKMEEQIEKIDFAVDQLIGKIDTANCMMTQLVGEVNSTNNVLSLIQGKHDEEILKIDTANNMISLIKSDIKVMYPVIKNNQDTIIANVNSIFSFCLNDNAKKNDDIRSTEIYKYYERLHKLTRCKDVVSDGVRKVRVGRKNDGGYVMLEPISREKIAYSLGICDDVSWDKDMADRGYEIYQYDHTIEGLPEKNNRFHWFKVGLTGQEETENLKQLETLIKSNGHNDVSGMVLKMDIEGYEWDVLLNTDRRILTKFDQITMEVHGLNDISNSDKIIKVFEKLSVDFDVIHIHGNNYRYAVFCGDYITPDVLEITMAKKGLYGVSEDDLLLMKKIDEANNQGTQDIWMTKW